MALTSSAKNRPLKTASDSFENPFGAPGRLHAEVASLNTQPKEPNTHELRTNTRRAWPLAEVKARSAIGKLKADLAAPGSRLFKQKKRAARRYRERLKKARERAQRKREQAILKRELQRARPLLKEHGLAIVKTTGPSPRRVAGAQV